jgi:Protein of unknown function (DUF4013)
MLDIRRALEYMADDPQASQKLGLGGVLWLAPVLNLAGVGYEVELARRVARGEPRPLPTWDDLGGLFVQGGRLGLAYFIYGLPILVIVLGGMVVLFVGLVFSIQSDAARSGAAPVSPAALVIGVFVCLLGAAFAYGLLFGLLRPAILAAYAQRGTIRACFDFGALWRFIRRDLGQYLLLWLTELALGWIISLPLIPVVFIVGLIPFVGPAVIALMTGAVNFFLLLVQGHLVGQLLQAKRSLNG